MTESAHQAAVVQYFTAKYPKYKIHAIPNGTHIKSWAGRNKAKKEGLVKGVSDLFIAVPRGKYHGFYLEMKNKGKTQCSVSPDQKAWIEYSQWQGYHSAWAAGSDEAIKLIDDYMQLSAYHDFMDTLSTIE